MLLVVNKLEQLPTQAVQLADIIVSREGKVLIHRGQMSHDPRRVKRALRLLGIKSVQPR
jgi:hypothetical protein